MRHRVTSAFLKSPRATVVASSFTITVAFTRPIIAMKRPIPAEIPYLRF